MLRVILVILVILYLHYSQAIHYFLLHLVDHKRLGDQIILVHLYFLVILYFLVFLYNLYYLYHLEHLELQLFLGFLVLLDILDDQ